MYKSIESWINIPAVLTKFDKYDGAGDKSYLPDTTNFYCYPEGQSIFIKDEYGNNVVSNLKLYVDGLLDIAINDKVTVESKTYDVKALAPYYRAGHKDLLVVYV